MEALMALVVRSVAGYQIFKSYLSCMSSRHWESYDLTCKSHVNENSLSGTLPSELWTLNHLQELFLGTNGNLLV